MSPTKQIGKQDDAITNSDNSNETSTTRQIPAEIEHFFDTEKDFYTPEKAAVDIALFEAIENDPSLSANSLTALLKKSLVPAVSENLFEDQGFIEHRVETILKRRDNIALVLAEHSTPEELYESLFSRKPVGKVSLIPSAISVNFKCDDELDFKHIYSEEYTEHPRNNYNSNIMGISVRDCREQRLDMAITAIKSQKKTEDSTESIEMGADTEDSLLAHEFQHIKTWMFAEKEDLALENFLNTYEHVLGDSFKNSETDLNQIETLATLISELTLEFKDKLEIAAYLTQGLSITETINLVKNSYKNDELAATRLKNFVTPTNAQINSETEKIINTVFEKHADSIESFEQELVEMSEAGYSTRIIGMRVANCHFRQLACE